MTINFNAYGFKSNDMNIADLEVGQVLLRVIRPEHYNSTREVEVRKYVVKKILKTRLVVESVEPHPIAALPGQTTKKHEIRLLVNQSKWSIRNGSVTTQKEGDSGYRAKSYEFATEDDQALVDQIVAHRAAQVEEAKIKRDAHQAVMAIKDRMHPDLESVEATILALQALADQLRAAQK